ncbi:COP9 signalosome complex subunit 8 [Phanerochaete sordida]|uniref:COP9 signalosome complex subunit 8 n=1 Tax=Phanerochaete sordida TaxID=48140 RepID=A0A9P3L9D1_9APHY|nr:COP9 signalosome complex subunit 8 [Phanerochaete sordida]
MTGPPTPPITSAIEIEDAARAAAAAATPALGANVVTGGTAPAAPGEPVAIQVAIAATPEQAASPYRQAFATLVELAVSGNFDELAEVAESADLTTKQDTSIERFLVVTPLVVSYFITDNIPPALQAITRLPEVLKAHAISQASFRLAASISERKYGNVYPRANDLLQAVENTQIRDADFKAVVGSLLRKFIDTFRQRTLLLLSKAYTSIPLSLAQSYLNCLPEEVLAVATQHRWGYDPSTQILTPKLPSKYGASGISGLATFDIIANTNLE